MSENYNDNQHYTLLEDLKASLNCTIDLCEKNSNKVDGREEDLWFPLLEQLYKMSKLCKDKSVEPRKVIFEEMSRAFSQDIKELLEKMCSYVSIQLIINVKNFISRM